jgi:hypothetical protein
MENLGIGYLLILVAFPIVMIVVFLIMASNISGIKQKLTTLPNDILKGTDENLYFGNREEWKSNNKQAIEYYLNYLYDLKRSQAVHLYGKTNKDSQDILIKAIQDLGGVVPVKDI